MKLKGIVAVLLLLFLLGGHCTVTISETTTEFPPPTDSSSVPEIEKPAGLAPEILAKIYSFTKNAKVFQNMTFNETATFFNDLAAWEAPFEIQKHFPYYLAGYDYDSRPIWVTEVGRFDFRRLVEQGGNTLVDFEKYLIKGAVDVIRSMQAKDTPDEEVREVLYVMDMEQMDMRQVGHLPTIAQGIRLGQKYKDLSVQFVGGVILINANYATRVLTDIARPVVGKLMEKVEVYGSSRAKWLPRLLRLFPIEALPPWYGGSEKFKPVEVHG